HDHRRKHDDQQHHGDLDDDERHSAPIDLTGGHSIHALASNAVDIGILRRDRAQIKQRKAERRVHERGLHVDAEDHPEPDQIDAEVFGGRPEQRNDDEGEFEEVEEEGEDEDKRVDENQKADLAAGQGGEQMDDPDMAV